ncbi:SSBP2 protein, partial [Atractosteus spatula]|nr:SSBP2 protein [Atractosteus spatula]
MMGPPGSQPSPHAQPPPHNPSNPMMGPHTQPFMSPRYPGGPRPPLRIPNQALGGVPGNQPLLPSGMDPTRQQGHPNMGGAMQRMTPPRGMVPLGPQVRLPLTAFSFLSRPLRFSSDPWLSLQSYGGAMRPPLNALGGPGMPGMNMGPGGGRAWPNPPNANSIPYSSASPGSYAGPPGGGGPPGTPIMPSPADSTNSGDTMYTMINAVPPGANRPRTSHSPFRQPVQGNSGGPNARPDLSRRCSSAPPAGRDVTAPHVCVSFCPQFPMGPGSDGPIGGMAGMEPHHMNGSLGSGDIDSISKSSPGNMSMSNQPGTPRDDGEMGGNFLNPFQNESVSGLNLRSLRRQSWSS